MGEPEKGDSFIAVVIGVQEEDDIAFPQFSVETGSLLGQRRCVDDGCRDIFGCADSWRDGNLRQRRLNLIRYEGIFDQGSMVFSSASAVSCYAVEYAYVIRLDFPQPSSPHTHTRTTRR